MRIKLLWLIIIALSACTAGRIGNSVQQSAIKVIQQEKKFYSFNNGQLFFSNQFSGARLNNVIQKNDSSFRLMILPENAPVNPSPWYAFKIWTTTPRTIYLEMAYTVSKHRYDPKLSYDAHQWNPVQGVQVSGDSSEIYFSIQLKKDTAVIAAQELNSMTDSYRWLDSLSGLPYLRKRVIGKSILGNPVTAVCNTGPHRKNIIVILSRQHPPEVTGYLAMQEFVRTIIDTTSLARQFRKNFELVIIPMVNPDGVDQGHWRHNMAGVDLNRDWETFLQPETAAIKNYLLSKTKKEKAKVLFGIDFHSTYHDVFYINVDTGTASNMPGFTARWLQSVTQAIPGFEPDIRPSPNSSNVSKSWMSRVLQAEAITYEVGDNTPAGGLKNKARVAAVALMELLLQHNR